MSKNTLSSVLNRYLAVGTFTAAQLAEWAGCSESLIYKVKDEERDLMFEKAQRLSLELSRRGANDITCLLAHPATTEVVRRSDALANGSLDDEIADAVEALGNSRLAHATTDVDGLDKQIQRLASILNRMKAERDRLNS